MQTSASTNCSRRGLTLIEVVAGLALMGTLLAAMLSAKGRFTRQQHHAQRVLVAVAALDDLLMESWHVLGTIEDTEYGEIEGQQGMTWRASVIEERAAEDWHCRIIRVEIIDATDNTDAEPLARVELLAPDPSYLIEITRRDNADPQNEGTELPQLKSPVPKADDPVSPIRTETAPPVLGVGP
ncbi:MAG: type II secretion system protein [Phycisphaerales bacterium]